MKDQTCIVQGCNKPAKARFLCSAHLYHAYKNGNLPSRMVPLRDVVAKVCPSCQREFTTKNKSKIFCTMRCYIASEQFARQHAESKRTITVNCLSCQKEMRFKPSIAKRFCSRLCYRSYFAARFDRFVANPESLALPQCYDEFLIQEELPCLFTGCDWKGKSLGQHVNNVHGITAAKFREIAGFNIKTALAVQSVCEKRSEVARRVFKEEHRFDIRNCDRSKRHTPRLEGREHAVKSRTFPEVRSAMSMAGHKVMSSLWNDPARREKHLEARRLRLETNRVTQTCEQCGMDYSTPTIKASRSKYCSQKCRNDHNNPLRRQKRKELKAPC